MVVQYVAFYHKTAMAGPVTIALKLSPRWRPSIATAAIAVLKLVVSTKSSWPLRRSNASVAAANRPRGLGMPREDVWRHGGVQANLEDLFNPSVGQHIWYTYNGNEKAALNQRSFVVIRWFLLIVEYIFRAIISQWLMITAY